MGMRKNPEQDYPADHAQEMAEPDDPQGQDEIARIGFSQLLNRLVQIHAAQHPVKQRGGHRAFLAGLKEFLFHDRCFGRSETLSVQQILPYGALEISSSWGFSSRPPIRVMSRMRNPSSGRDR